jgi:hypothetical protein
MNTVRGWNNISNYNYCNNQLEVFHFVNQYLQGRTKKQRIQNYIYHILHIKPGNSSHFLNYIQSVRGDVQV